MQQQGMPEHKELLKQEQFLPSPASPLERSATLLDKTSRKCLDLQAVKNILSPSQCFFMGFAIRHAGFVNTARQL